MLQGLDRGLVGSVTCSHDSRLLAAASINPISENSINAWDITTGNCLQTLLHERIVLDVLVQDLELRAG